MFPNLGLWHVTCSHFHENGCYGCESADNEIATGDSGLRRNHPSATTASAAWSPSHSVALARDSYYCHQAETDHRRRYARAGGHPASCKDHSFAPGSSARDFSHNHQHRHRNSGCLLVQIFHPCCSSRRKQAPYLAALPGRNQPYVGCYSSLKFPRLIEDRIRIRLAQFEAPTTPFSRL